MAFPVRKRIVGTPAVSRGLLFSVSADLQNIRSECSKRKLIVDSGNLEPVLGAVTIDNGTAYIGASVPLPFRAINTCNGEYKVDFYRCKGLH